MKEKIKDGSDLSKGARKFYKKIDNYYCYLCSVGNDVYKQRDFELTVELVDSGNKLSVSNAYIDELVAKKYIRYRRITKRYGYMDRLPNFCFLKIA